MTVVSRGHVSDRPFARSIYWIAAKQFTGELVMTQDGQSCRLAWEHGLIVAADSDVPSDSFARVALTAGLVTSTQISAVIREVTLSRRGQLEVLREVARLSPEQVNTIEKRAFAQRALRIFALERASFVLDNELSLARDPDLPTLSVRWLLYQGVRTHYSEERLRKEMSAVDGMRFRLAASAGTQLSEFGVGLPVRRWLGTLGQSGSSGQSLDEVFASCSELSRKEVLAALYALLAADAIEATGERRPRAKSTTAPGAAPPPNRSAAPAQPATASPSRPYTRPTNTQTPALGQPTAVIAPSDDDRGAGRTVPIPRVAKRPPGAVPAPSPSAAVEAAPGAPLSAADSGPAARGSEDGEGPDPVSPSGVAARAVKIKRTRRRTSLQPVSSSELRRLVAAKVEQMGLGVDHYALLGVDAEASDEAIRDAYFELAGKLHPDRLRAVGINDLALESQRVCAEINLAFGVLSNRDKRAEYDASKSGAEGVDTRDPEAAAEAVLAAEQHFRRGEWALRRQRWEEALEQFERAATLAPKETDHQVMFAWARWCATEAKSEIAGDVVSTLETALRNAPRNRAALYYRGRVGAALGDTERALRCFRRVVEIDPSYQDARLQARLLESRQNESGLLGRIKQTGRVFKLGSNKKPGDK
ncbi:heat shock protein DnaJ domain protein [Haliangium ochraceum DSM 14365]|uniref:Heat shock protein DnaJ domain protein n=1 Tax=Haliangium ochraceum (strain DSM 14365 / JCM 11303 / SMP-2) TaxID=502025 RepID=D0LUB3_HALO1|nr:heat shock protein DnaJ domain protein [Haliangium ochraceum DSM 14365]